MRTVINLDDKACAEVMEMFELRTKTDAVNLALREMARRRRLKIAWDSIKDIEVFADPEAHYREHGPEIK